MILQDINPQSLQVSRYTRSQLEQQYVYWTGFDLGIIKSYPMYKVLLRTVSKKDQLNKANNPIWDIHHKLIDEVPR